MRLRPNLLLLPLALLAAGLVALVLVQTAGALEQVDRAEREKGETLQRTVISAMRGVVRYGRDKRERVEAVIDEIAKDPIVVAVTIRDGAGKPFIVRGPEVPLEGGDDPGPDVLRLVMPFELRWDHPGRRGARAGGHGRGGQVPPGSYRLVLDLDRGPAAQVSRLIVLQAVGLSVSIVLAALVGWLLMGSIRQRERLTRRVEVKQHKLESLESLRLLAAGLAHEIRNPLGAIRGYAQLLHEQAADDDDASDKTGVMLSELDRVGERLEEFLAFARKRKVSLAPLQLVTVARDVVSLLAPDAEAGGITLACEEPEEAPVRCLGDGKQLKELVLNLALNAIAACAEGDTVTLRLTTAGEQAELTVEDTGKGIEPDDLERVFEPYFTTRDTGSGLGLAISKRIAEGHDGSLEVHSTPGVGTTMRLRLPCNGGPPPAA
ncbi:MAG: hypothetical protein JRI68_13920 [Deltaproteobacteria bacterium]|nr:hypothetical protein [Deltaproteobacteria bacterium]